jgi:hypothetical protein
LHSLRLARLSDVGSRYTTLLTEVFAGVAALAAAWVDGVLAELGSVLDLWR